MSPDVLRLPCVFRCVLAITCLLVGLTGASDAQQLTSALPQVNPVAVDGDLGEWQQQGFAIYALAGTRGAPTPPQDLDAQLFLAWDDHGVVMGLRVDDDVFTESGLLSPHAPPEVLVGSDPTPGDAVEVQALTPRARLGVWVSPGIDPRQRGLQVRVQDLDRLGQAPDEDLSVEAAKRPTDTGYTLEMRLPWTSLGLGGGETGQRLQLGLSVYDADQGAGQAALVWRRYGSGRVEPVVLGGPDAVSAQRLAVSVDLADRWRLARRRLVLSGDPALAGRRVRLVVDGQPMDETTLSRGNQRSVGVLLGGEPTRRAAIMLDESPDPVAIRPAATGIPPRRLAMTQLDVEPERYVFDGRSLPLVQVENPLLAERLFGGAYELGVEYVNAVHEPVQAAQRAGRYGAVVELTRRDDGSDRDSAGVGLTRFVPLYRLKAPVDWRVQDIDAQPRLPEALGIDPQVAYGQAATISRFLQQQLVAGFRRDPQTAVLLSGLFETPPNSGALTPADAPRSLHRAWWAEHAARRAQSRSPQPAAGQPGYRGRSKPPLDVGPTREAGVASNAPRNLGEFCADWANQTEIAINVCAARNGVIFYHEGLGFVHGEPADTATASPMGALARLPLALLSMDLVGQGVLALDQPLPPGWLGLDPDTASTDLTLRHLLSHTAGLHHLDPLRLSGADLPERLAACYAHLPMGRSFAPSHTGDALTAAILERVSGRSVSRLVRDRLIRPLDLLHLAYEGPTGDNRATAVDLAAMGQLLLNDGVWGETRLLSEDAVAAMRPQPLTATLGDDTEIVGGLALQPMHPGVDKAGDDAFGLVDPATGSLLLVDPEQDLVLAITRDRPGPQYDTILSKFLALTYQQLRAGGGYGGGGDDFGMPEF